MIRPVRHLIRSQARRNSIELQLLETYRMHHLSTLAIACAMTGLLWLCDPNCGHSIQAADPPNVVVIMVDDLGYSDIGCYGGEIDTPNLDSLASNGLRFSQFYNTAKCHSSRVSLLTGQYCIAAGNTKMDHAVTTAEVVASRAIAPP